jgi:hypothetical protein
MKGRENADRWREDRDMKSDLQLSAAKSDVSQREGT